MVKMSPRALLVIYLSLLVWIVLFKLSFNMPVLLSHHIRNINLIPFASPVPPFNTNYQELIYNCIFFVPFGFLLSLNFKKISFWRKLSFIALFSLSAELIQYVFAIGTTDITDLITNTFGGFIGLVIYGLCKSRMNNEKLDKIILYVGNIVLILFLLIVVAIFGRRLIEVYR